MDRTTVRDSMAVTWNTPQGQEMTHLEGEMQEIRRATAELGRRIDLWRNRALVLTSRMLRFV
jgi:hypothetical protein